MIKNLADVKGDAALDLVADLIDPVTEIMSDPVVAAAYRGTEKEPGSKAKAIKVAIKTHKKAVTTILALMDEEALALLKVFNLENEATMKSANLPYGKQRKIVTSADQSSEENTSGSVSENSKDED